MGHGYTQMNTDYNDYKILIFYYVHICENRHSKIKNQLEAVV